MIPPPLINTRTATLFPYPTPCRRPGAGTGQGGTAGTAGAPGASGTTGTTGTTESGASGRGGGTAVGGVRAGIAVAASAAFATVAACGHAFAAVGMGAATGCAVVAGVSRSEEHTSELQSLMRISYAVFCLKKKKNSTQNTYNTKTNRK